MRRRVSKASRLSWAAAVALAGVVVVSPNANPKLPLPEAVVVVVSPSSKPNVPLPEPVVFVAALVVVYLKQAKRNN
jgi:hypothetical protein